MTRLRDFEQTAPFVDPFEQPSPAVRRSFTGASWVGVATTFLSGVGLLSAGHAGAAGLAFAGSLCFAAFALGYRGRNYRSVELLRASAARRDLGVHD